MEMRVFGPPGTGKTTYLARQVGEAVARHGSRAVMVASFTRTAAAEIAGRDLPLERHQVGTLHAHCYRALGRPEIAETKISEWNKEVPHFRLSGEGGSSLDEPALEVQPAGGGDMLMRQYQIMRAQMVARNAWPVSLQSFAKKWEDWKESNGLIDFTDMIDLCHQEIGAAPGRPAIGFFDEVQDFTPLELALIRKWGAHMEHIILAGDDDQAIYSWLGATPNAFLDPPVPPSQKRVLAQSYRLPRSIQVVAERWIARVSRREDKTYLPREIEGQVLESPANWKAPEKVLADAETYLTQGKTVMLLVSCSYMLDPLKAVLRQEGLPFHNPYRRTRGDWNPLKASRGTSSAQRLLAYMKLDPEVWGEEAGVWTPDDLRAWTDLVKADGVFRPKRKGAVRGLTGDAPVDVDLLGTILTDEAIERLNWLLPIGSDLDWFEEHLLESSKRVLGFPLAIVRRRGGQVLRETPKIIIGTIHSVKGGEADAVFLFPDLSPAGMREYMSDADSTIRQFYVGLTRAREALVLCSPATGFAVRGLN